MQTNRFKLIQFSLAVLIATSLSTGALANEDITVDDVLSMSLEDLSNIEITSVSKKAEKASEAAAAIYVVTQEDIQRSGFTSIPEALRMVPGVQVAQSASHQWAVTIRGFNSQFANKLLVMIDGRSIYTPVFSGVIWDVQDTLMEDIERIEVIRGPGGTLWGANAVNGIINIITKNAKDTQGSYASLTMGNHEDGSVAARHGGKIGDDSYYRAYVKHSDRDALENATTGLSARDNWRKSQAGFRTDSTISDVSKLTVQGDVYYSNEKALLNLPSFTAPGLAIPSIDNTSHRGLNLLGRYQHKLSDISDVTLQGYYDVVARDHAYYNGRTHTLDADFQHEWRGFDRHEMVWGLGYRMIRDENKDTLYHLFDPKERTDHLVSGFVQDEIALVQDEVFLTLGSKFEHNDYTGFEFQPSARFSWLIGDDHTLWGSVARAVRTPNRFSDDTTLRIAAQTTPAPGFTEVKGDSTFASEELITYELGYRVRPHERVSLDVSTFYNDYDKVTLSQLGTPGFVSDPIFGAYLSVPLSATNNNEARSFGVEVSSNVDLSTKWQLTGSYSYLNLDFKQPFAIAFSTANRHPKHQFNIRSTYKFPWDIEMTNALYYTDELKGISIKEHYRFDTRIAWQPADNLEFSLVGQNLLDPQHQEFSGFLYQNAAQVGRSVYGKLTYRF